MATSGLKPPFCDLARSSCWRTATWRTWSRGPGKLIALSCTRRQGRRRKTNEDHPLRRSWPMLRLEDGGELVAPLPQRVDARERWHSAEGPGETPEATSASEVSRTSLAPGALMLSPIGLAVPRRGNGLSRGVGRLVLRGMGWCLEGAVPNVPRWVAIIAPHTSHCDFV